VVCVDQLGRLQDVKGLPSLARMDDVKAEVDKFVAENQPHVVLLNASMGGWSLLPGARSCCEPANRRLTLLGPQACGRGTCWHI
jgi:hypothetical protein